MSHVQVQLPCSSQKQTFSTRLSQVESRKNIFCFSLHEKCGATQLEGFIQAASLHSFVK